MESNFRCAPVRITGCPLPFVTGEHVDLTAINEVHTHGHNHKFIPNGAERIITIKQRVFAAFLDTGSFWDQGADHDVPTSAGFGYHGGHFFMMLGFPLNAGELRAAFMMGVRF